MTKFFVFNTEQEAEDFCTKDCPIYGRDLEGNEVRDKGITLRVAEWRKHPKTESWLVDYDEALDTKMETVIDLDENEIFPRDAVSKMVALNK